MANQFSRRGPAHKIKTGHDEQTKDKIRAERLAKRLFKYANAKGKAAEKYHMESAQVQAAKVLIERGKPALQAVESRTVEEPMTEEQLMAQLHSLLSDPAIRAQIRVHLEGLDHPANDHVQAQQSGEKAA
jgi:predicted RecB family nuclease